MTGERRYDRDRAGRDHDRRGHERDDYRSRDYGRGENIDYGGYPEAALGHGRGGAGYRGEGNLGYGRGGRIDYGGYPRGALGSEEFGPHPGRERDYGGGSYGRGGYSGGFGFGGDLEGVGEYRGIGPRGYTRSDERIREDLCDRLTEDPHLDASGIEVQVSNGEVTLSGTIRTRPDKRHAEDIADAVAGVKHVQNNLRLQEHGPGGTAGEAPATPHSGQAGTPGEAPAAANEPDAKRGRSVT